MHQELTTTPPIFPEISLEKVRTISRSSVHLCKHDAPELLIFIVLVGLAGMVLLGLPFVNSEPMQIAQSTPNLLPYLK